MQQKQCKVYYTQTNQAVNAQGSTAIGQHKNLVTQKYTMHIIWATTNRKNGRIISCYHVHYCGTPNAQIAMQAFNKKLANMGYTPVNASPIYASSKLLWQRWANNTVFNYSLYPYGFKP